MEEQRAYALNNLTPSQRSQYDQQTNIPTSQGAPPEEIKRNQENWLNPFIPGFTITGDIDAWAFGVLLFETMHARPDLSRNLGWDHRF